MKKSDKQPNNIRLMFGRISKKYNLLNRLMSFGFDRAWRRFVIGMAGIPEGGRILDAGSGTGDIAIEIMDNYPSVTVTAVDLTYEMMSVGRQRAGGNRIDWCQADAGNLPFPDFSFDAVTSGFLARNVPDAGNMFREQGRVLKSGGRIVCLDTSPIPDNILRPLILIYYKLVIPFMGRMIAGEKNAYKYLPETTIGFLEPEALARTIEKAGFKDVGYKTFMFGNISVHWGTKPERD
jgi:demethylmenaquinone methyltransferase/2-methoxy-6-polyprenyl-1,4-benzoquinol methylase